MYKIRAGRQGNVENVVKYCNSKELKLNTDNLHHLHPNNLWQIQTYFPNEYKIKVLTIDNDNIKYKIIHVNSCVIIINKQI